LLDVLGTLHTSLYFERRALGIYFQPFCLVFM
jgi:hypothetical protein